MVEEKKAEEKKVEVTLGQPAFIDGEERPAGYVARVPQHMAKALEYVPKPAAKAADGEKSEKG